MSDLPTSTSPDAPATGPAVPPPGDAPEGAPTGGPATGADPADDDDIEGDDAPEGDAAGTAPDPATAKARKQAATYRQRARDAKAEKEAAEAAAAAATAAAAAATEESTRLTKLFEGFQALLNPDAKKDEPLDPAKLADQLAAVQAERETERASHAETVRKLTVDAALPAVLAKLDADPDLTPAVLASTGALAALDPTSKTFRANLEAAVKAALEATPKLKVTAPITRTGTDPTGAVGPANQITREQLAGMTTAQITEAQAQGRLKALLGG